MKLNLSVIKEKNHNSLFQKIQNASVREITLGELFKYSLYLWENTYYSCQTPTHYAVLPRSASQNEK